MYFSPEVQKGPPPSLPCLIFVISYFICFYLPCLILPSFPPPCAGVVKRAGLGERLKSHREYLIRNSKASSAHLGRARRRRAARLAPPQRHQGGQSEGRDWQGSENATAAVEGHHRPSFIAQSCFMSCLRSISLDASPDHPTPLPTLLSLPAGGDEARDVEGNEEQNVISLRPSAPL